MEALSSTRSRKVSPSRPSIVKTNMRSTMRFLQSEKPLRMHALTAMLSATKKEEFSSGLRCGWWAGQKRTWRKLLRCYTKLFCASVNCKVFSPSEPDPNQTTRLVLLGASGTLLFPWLGGRFHNRRSGGYFRVLLEQSFFLPCICGTNPADFFRHI